MGVRIGRASILHFGHVTAFAGSEPLTNSIWRFIKSGHYGSKQASTRFPVPAQHGPAPGLRFAAARRPGLSSQ